MQEEKCKKEERERERVEGLPAHPIFIETSEKF